MTAIPASMESIELKGIYLVNNSNYIYIYILKDSSEKLI